MIVLRLLRLNYIIMRIGIQEARKGLSPLFAYRIDKIRTSPRYPVMTNCDRIEPIHVKLFLRHP